MLLHTAFSRTAQRSHEHAPAAISHHITVVVVDGNMHWQAMASWMQPLSPLPRQRPTDGHDRQRRSLRTLWRPAFESPPTQRIRCSGDSVSAHASPTARAAPPLRKAGYAAGQSRPARATAYSLSRVLHPTPPHAALVHALAFGPCVALLQRTVLQRQWPAATGCSCPPLCTGAPGGISV